ncbi:MAG: YkgJ family cysteine cluster protein [Planctomycetota bacterium]|jgi:Fe-S-cluster containining protein
MSGQKRLPLTGDQCSQLQERILKDCPRLGPDDTFKFACHPGVSCFNRCCGDVNIFLSPYDVLRMKRRLGMKSGDFLEKYTLMPVQKEMKTPVVVLRMNDDEAKTCPFLTDAGCGVYSDRPWPCRMYPLGLASQKDTPDGWRGERFYFLLSEEVCKGWDEPQQWTVRQWFDDQGIDQYDEWGEAFKELTLHQYFEEGGTLSPEKMHMFFTACYDADKFREFVFGSTLLKRFEVDEDFVEQMRYDDEALLRFAFLWLRFSLFGEQTVKVKPEVAEAFKGSLDKKELFDKQPAKAPREETP